MYFHHCTYNQIKQNIVDHEKYFIFSFVRNPWDRVVSTWKYRLNFLKTGPRDHPFTQFCKNNIDSDFNVFVKSKNIMKPPPCYNWVYDEHDQPIDYIGKMESLQSDFDTISIMLNLNKQQLPWLNKTDHLQYHDYYDDDSKTIVEDLYSKDIHTFSYKFY